LLCLDKIIFLAQPTPVVLAAAPNIGKRLKNKKKNVDFMRETCHSKDIDAGKATGDCRALQEL
jgi:hypothetical protein